MIATTGRRNVLRGNSLSAINARKKECKYGHPFDATNTYLMKDGHRACKECGRRSALAFYHKKAKRK